MVESLFAKYDKSLFKKAWNAIIAQPKMFIYIFLLDAGFFLLFWLLNVLTNIIVPSDPSFLTKVQENTTLMVSMILLFLVYIVVLVLAYSFINLVIMGNIKTLSKKHNHDFSMLKNMFLLNLLLFFLFFLLLVIMNTVLVFIINKSVWFAIVLFIILAILFLGFYIFYSFTHSAFILGHDLKNVLSKSVKHIFTNSYLGLFLFSFIVLAVYFGLYVMAGLLFNDFIVNNYASYVNVSSIISLVLVYILFSFNRIYFFFIAEKHLGHK